EREATNRNFDATFRSRLNDPATGTIILIMQRLHDSDLTGHVLSQEPNGWTHLKLPAEFEENMRWEVNGHAYEKAAGELLWPGRFSHEVLAGLKTGMGSWSFAGQYQQNPAPLEGGIVKREWLQYYRELPELGNGFGNRGNWVQSWDCSFKDSRESDYVVGQVWLRFRSGFYLVDQIRERMDFVRTKQA